MNSIKETLAKLECEKREISKKIKEIKDKCPHENTKSGEYYDYDSEHNCTLVQCLDCGAIIFDGETREFEKSKLYKNIK